MVSGRDLHTRVNVLVPIVEPVGTPDQRDPDDGPLVVGSIIVGVTSAPDARTIGRIGSRARLLLVLLVAGGSLPSCPLMMARIPLDPHKVAALRERRDHGVGDVKRS
jgi:hypothetical protein